MIGLALIGAATLATAPACAPEHAAMGHCTPVESAAAAPSEETAAQDDPACPPEHAAMGHCTPRASQAPMIAEPRAESGAAPPAPTANYADRIWGKDAMAPARARLRREHGGGTFSQTMIDIAELQVRSGRDGLRWEGEHWTGGDINRLVLKSEGSAQPGSGVEEAEVQALYSRAIGPYFNLQAGVRQDLEPSSRTYAVVGVDGPAPYWFEIEAHAFLSTKGDLLGRVTASYDQRITQRLILQPRAEFNLAAQDIRADGVGAGLSEAELGLRLRYEIQREFAPYLGVSYQAKTGGGADYARALGEDPTSFNLVFGLRAWF